MVISAFSQVLRFKPDADQVSVQPETYISTMGLDSLDIAEVIVLIEQSVGYELDYFSVPELRKVSDFSKFQKASSTDVI